MQVITLCGSLRYQNEMMIVAQKLALEGMCVLTPTYKAQTNVKMTEEQLIGLKNAHFKRIDMSDSVFIVNVGNYIGDSTRLEIEYAEKLGKKIVYYTDWVNENC